MRANRLPALLPLLCFALPLSALADPNWPPDWTTSRWR